jgi:chromosomal replication initiation ATPase DnaA
MQSAMDKIPGLKELLDATALQIETLIGKPVQVFYKIEVRGLRATDLLDIVCEVCEVEREDMLSKKRYRELVTARQLFCHVAHTELRLTQERISKILGMDSHTSARHNILMAVDFIETNDGPFMNAYEALMQRISEKCKTITGEKVQTEIQS